MSLRKVKRAIISVSDKSSIETILPSLKKFNIEIISSGGSFKQIKKLKYNCLEVSNYTGLSEMLDGRVKSLHPKIYAGILNVRKNKKHTAQIIKNNIPSIDLVIVDLYPFEKKINEGLKFDKLIEYIDIGGPTLLRAAAKNYSDVAVISNINDYDLLANELKKNKGATTFSFRKYMSAKAYNLTAYYDSIISNYLNNELNIKFPEKKTFYGKLQENLRYGENPHQEGSLYTIGNKFNLEKIHGKNLSYNNYNDINSALDILKSFKKNEGSVIVKHANPCGASIEKDQVKSFVNALTCDPVSAFGGVVAINSVVSKKLALELNKVFFEIIISKGFKKDALKILKKKKNISLITCHNFNSSSNENYQFLGNSFLIQDSDNVLFQNKLKIVTKKKPTIAQLNSMKFAFNICKFVKSNAIVLANGKSTIGIGSGQPSRLDSCKIASSKALKFIPKKILDSVAASDAFFPFDDGIKELKKVGVSAIIQPGGSINDKSIIDAANRANLAMVFTGIRHFKH